MQRTAISVIVVALGGCAVLAPRPPIEVEHFIPSSAPLPSQVEDCRPAGEYDLMLRDAEHQVFRVHYTDGHNLPNYKEAIEVRDRVKAHRSRCERLRAMARMEEQRAQEEEERRRKAEELQSKIDAIAAERKEFWRQVETHFEKLSTPEREAALLHGLLCEARLLERGALAAIEDEREAAKIAGLVNQLKLYSAQQIVHRQRKRAAALEREIRARVSQVPKACDDETFLGLAICHRAGWPKGECVHDGEEAMAEAMRQKLEELDVDG